MAKKKKEETNIVEKDSTLIEDSFEVIEDAENILKAEEHANKALSFIKENKKEEAEEEINIAYSLDENNAYIFLAKLYLKYHLRSFNDFAKKADNEIINSSFFKAAYELGDINLKEKLDEVVQEVEYKEVEIKLEDADVEQLLKHLRIQKQRGIDYTYTISLILSILYRSFRYIDKEYIDSNYTKDNFIPILKKMESSFQFYMDILYHFDDIQDIKDIAYQCVKNQKEVLSYALIYIKKLIENTDDIDKLNEIKDFLEFAYLNHEADDLLNEIKPKIKRKPQFSFKGLSIALVSFIFVLGVVGISILASISAINAPVTFNGVTYQKNENGGYTIIGYDFENSVVTFENSINDLPVNEIKEGVFTDSSIVKITNFPSSITSIPVNEFYSCDYLNEFSFCDSSSSLLKEIGNSAFEDCTSLTTLTIPMLVENIGENAFKNTPYLVNLTKESLYDFDESYIGLTKRNLSIDFAGGNEYSYESYYYSWDTITLKDIDKKNYDFRGFKVNDDLNDFKELNEDTVSFSAKGYYSISLKAIYETASLISDDNGVIYKLSDDKTYYIISDYKASEDNLNRITLAYQINGIPVKELSETAFSNNRSLIMINNFSPYIKEIPENAFKNCIALEYFIFSDITSELETIDENAFYNCISLKEFNLPSSVKTIGDNAFYGTSNLLTFNNTYEWKIGEDNPYFDMERIGFIARNYVIKNEENEVVKEGIYYACEEKLTIKLDVSSTKRAVIKNNISEEITAYEINKTYAFIDVSGNEKLDLTIYYETYYDSSLYTLTFDEPRSTSSYSVYSDKPIEISISASLKDSSSNKISGNYTVTYEVIEYTSTISCSISKDNKLVISKNIEGSGNGTVGFKAFVRGEKSNEVMISSSIEYLRVNLF